MDDSGKFSRGRKGVVPPALAYPAGQSPHDLDRERAVLNGILLAPDVLPEVLDLIRSDDFYHTAHQEIFKAMLKLMENRTPIDVISLAGQLKDNALLDGIGGPSYLVEIQRSPATGEHAKEYAIRLKELSLRRKILKATQEASSVILRAGEVKDLVNEVERIVFAATQERASSNVASLHEVLQLTVDEIDRRAQRAGDEPEGVLTGLPDLDRKVFAFGPGQLVIIAARPGQGKTSLAGNVIANAVSKQGKTVLFFSLEMLRTEIGTRLLAAEAMVDFSKIRRSDNLSTQEWDAIYQGAERLQSGGDLFIDDRSALTPYDIVSTARKLDTVLRAQGKRPLDMIVVDYIQIMRSGQSAESKAVEVGQISGALKSIAKDFKIPVVALAQLNREGARQGTEGRPQLIHLKDSGSIEQDADLVLLIHRNQSDQTDSRAATEAEIIVAKNRNGETGPVSVMWLGHLTSFTSAVRAGSYAADVVASFENDQPPQY